jgi:hypothetical protein
VESVIIALYEDLTGVSLEQALAPEAAVFDQAVARLLIDVSRPADSQFGFQSSL